MNKGKQVGGDSVSEQINSTYYWTGCQWLMISTLSVNNHFVSQCMAAIVDNLSVIVIVNEQVSSDSGIEQVPSDTQGTIMLTVEWTCHQ